MAIKKRYKFSLISLIVMFLAYLLVGYLLAPKIIAELLTAQTSKHLAMQAEFSKVTFNPLTFSTRIKDFKLTDSNQQTWYNSQSTGLNLDPVNLLWGEINLSALSLNQAEIIIDIGQDGTVQTPALPAFESSNTSKNSLNLTIENIELKQVSMALQVGTIQENFSLNIKNIALDHDAFNLGDHDNHFEIKISTEQDEAVAINGHYNHVRKTLKSDLKLIDWQATILNQVLPNDLGINTESGLFQADGHIDWQFSQKPQLKFSVIKVNDLQSSWHNDVLITDFQAELIQISVDIETKTVGIKHINSDQGKWQISWPMSAFYTNNHPLDAQTHTEDDKNHPLNRNLTDSKTWKITTEQINIKNWPIELVDTDLHETLALNLLSLDVHQANNLNQPFTLNSQLKLSDESRLQINSEQTLFPLSMATDIKVEQLTLNQIAPWLNNFAGLTSVQGKLSSSQRFDVAGDEFSVLGQLSITDGQITDRTGQIQAVWDEIHIGAYSVSSVDKSIIFDQITLNQASGTFNTDTNQNINIQNSHDQGATSKPTDSDQWLIKIGELKSKNKDLTPEL